MEKAKQAISGFLSKDGKHNTTVHETVNPAVLNEHVTRTHHENIQKVVDREVHQDHHHTSIQPIHHKEMLPEQHTHNMGSVEHRNFQHGNVDHVRQRLEAEKAQFKNTREVSDAQQTSTDIGIVTGEHIHHHVHETIQPVIQKETIQPSVIHTTIPIHEVHHNEAKHHNATQLPVVTMDEFKRQGGHLTGREERTDAFNGEPKAVGGTLGGHGARGTTSLTDKTGVDGHNGNSTYNYDEYSHGIGTTGTTGTTGSTGTTGTAGMTGATGTIAATRTTSSLRGESSAAYNKKPGLLAKLNPLKDADGDGKKGIMD